MKMVKIVLTIKHQSLARLCFSSELYAGCCQNVFVKWMNWTMVTCLILCVTFMEQCCVWPCKHPALRRNHFTSKKHWGWGQPSHLIWRFSSKNTTAPTMLWCSAHQRSEQDLAWERGSTRLIWSLMPALGGIVSPQTSWPGAGEGDLIWKYGLCRWSPVGSGGLGSSMTGLRRMCGDRVTEGRSPCNNRDRDRQHTKES